MGERCAHRTFTLRPVVRPKLPLATERVFQGFRGLLNLVLQLPARGSFFEVYHVARDAQSLWEAGPKRFPHSPWPDSVLGFSLRNGGKSRSGSYNSTLFLELLSVEKDTCESSCAYCAMVGSKNRVHCHSMLALGASSTGHNRAEVSVIVCDSDFFAAFLDALFPTSPAPLFVHQEENAIRACSSQRVVRNGPFSSLANLPPMISGARSPIY